MLPLLLPFLRTRARSKLLQDSSLISQGHHSAFYICSSSAPLAATSSASAPSQHFYQSIHQASCHAAETKAEKLAKLVSDLFSINNTHTHTHTRTHARTHTRTHARTHTRTHTVRKRGAQLKGNKDDLIERIVRIKY